jgi:hypothetical protein
MNPWTGWKIVKCPGEKVHFRLVGTEKSQVVHVSTERRLSFLGFMDASRPARHLEDIGSTWRISGGIRGYDQPIGLLREGKHRLAFFNADDGSFDILGIVDGGCTQQVDIDPIETGTVVTVRKGKTGDVIQEQKWAHKK